jgi:hypothetical protein
MRPLSSFKTLVKPSLELFQLTSIPVATAAQSQHLSCLTLPAHGKKSNSSPQTSCKSFLAASRPFQPFYPTQSSKHCTACINTCSCASSSINTSTASILSPSHTRNYENVVHSFRCICPGSLRGRTIRQHHRLTVDATLCHCSLQP